MIKKSRGYWHSYATILSLVLIGFSAELLFVDFGLPMLVFPINIIMLGCLIVSGFIIARMGIFKQVKDWLLSRAFIITLITMFSFLIMISGYLPQKRFPQYPILEDLGLFNITSSIPFTILMFLIIISLLVAVINRLCSFKKSHVAFIVNHTGILLVLVGGIFGAGDLVQLKIELKKGEVSWQGRVSSKPSITVDLPFALKLTEFILEEYDPEMIIIDKEDRVISKCGILMKEMKGKICSINGFAIELESFLSNGFKVKDNFIAVDHMGTSPVAKVSVKDNMGKQVNKGFVVQGSSLQASQYVKVDKNYRLVIPMAKPRKFSSKGFFYTPKKEMGDFYIEVNKPFALNGWKLYQHGYDDRMGKWSNTSVIEAVRDPWLPVIYAGIFIMIFGSLFLMFPNNRFMRQPDE